MALWAECINNNQSFWAAPVKNQSSDGYAQFKRHEIVRDNIQLMGYCCPETAEGDYYLETNGHPPYARSMQGIDYQSPLPAPVSNIGLI